MLGVPPRRISLRLVHIAIPNSSSNSNSDSIHSSTSSRRDNLDKVPEIVGKSTLDVSKISDENIESRNGKATSNFLDQEVVEACTGFHDPKLVQWAVAFLPSSAKESGKELKISSQNDNDHQTKNTVIEVIGAVAVVPYHDGVHVCNLCVDPSHRRSGLGLRLIREAGKFAVARHCEDSSKRKEDAPPPRLLGSCNGKDEKIIGFYRALGAKVDKRRMGIGSKGYCFSSSLSFCQEEGKVAKEETESDSLFVPKLHIYEDLPSDAQDVDPFFDRLEEERILRTQLKRAMS